MTKDLAKTSVRRSNSKSPRTAESRRNVVELHQGRGDRRGRHHRGIHQIGMGHLLDFMSEMLVLQKNSIQLMTLARDRASTPDIRQAMEGFIESTENRADEVRTLVRELGGNPVFVSPSAQVQQQRANAALQLAVPSRLQPLCDVENCWYASLQENVHLAFLRSIIPYLDSTLAQDRLEDMLEVTAREQEERLEWLQQTLHRLLLQRAVMPANGNDWYRAA